MPHAAVIVGVAQMRVGADLGVNLRGIADFAEMAQTAKADFLCFPECALTGYAPALHESSADFDADAVEAAVAEVRGIARERKVSLVLGAHLPLDGGWTNSALLVRSDGRLVLRYDKAHLYGWDAEYYRAGRERAKTISVKGARIGAQICFDIRFPEPFRALSLGGAQMIFAPSHIHGERDMWKGPVIASHVSSRAAENGRFVVFANTAGRTQNVPSMIANPRGEIVARCRKGAEQLLVAEADLSKVNDEYIGCRRTDLY